MTKVKNSPKICGVCGDKALGRNFCAVSCESCKAFFRRNASEYERMRCHFGDNCLIDIESRSNCRKCRLKKCFAIGMRKEWILNDEEKEIRKRKIQDNRQKKCNKIVDKLDDNSSSSQSMVTTDHEVSDNLFEILDNVDINEDKLNSQIKEIENSLSNDSYSNEMSTELQVIPIVRPINNNAFNETESMRFTELMGVLDFIRFPKLTITSQVQDLFDAMKMAVNKFDEICRKSVKGFKRLNAFKTLCKNDQILLLKSNGSQLTALRSMTIYDYQYKQWVVPIDDNNSTLMHLKVFKNNNMDVYSPIKILCEMSKDMDSDETLIDLLTAIVLFTPNHPNLIHKEVIKYQQKVYMFLLLRYLQLKCGCEADTIFKRIIHAKRYADILNRKVILKFLDALPHDISPLFNEMFDRV